jgi:hypothetical protein
MPARNRVVEKSKSPCLKDMSHARTSFDCGTESTLDKTLL